MPSIQPTPAQYGSINAARNQYGKEDLLNFEYTDLAVGGLFGEPPSGLVEMVWIEPYGSILSNRRFLFRPDGSRITWTRGG